MSGLEIIIGKLSGSQLRPAFKSFRQFGLWSAIIVLLALFSFQSAFSQQTKPGNLFPNGRPEVYFKFYKPVNISISSISRIISIDRRRGDTIYAYANPSEFRRFQQFNITSQIHTAPSLLTKAAMSDNAKGMQTWDTYPTYSAYVSMMQTFATAYPALCHLDTIGTSQNGHLLLFLEISNHPRAIEAKPEFMYSSTMHGDEVTGYVLMLRLIDYLLSNYGTDSLVTRLVNNLHIWINPLANPDGTYAGGDNTVIGATRYLSSGWDPNRNYPDPQYGPHPDGDVKWEKETIAMMNFVQKHQFVMSANFHGGDEVVNYPWDTWVKRHPDDTWMQFISKEYADSVQYYGPASYFQSVELNGYTDGYDWYTINGGRQDYMTYYLHGRETTIELSIAKTPTASYLPTYWTANYRSFLHYMEESTFGLHGIISDSSSGKPVRAAITIPGHDADHSEVYSDSITGYYTRLIAAGNYNFLISATGYYSKLVTGVSISNRHTTLKNIKLIPNKLPPVLKDSFGQKMDTLLIEMIPDSMKTSCLHISDPEKQLAFIDTILTSNSNVTATFAYHDSCFILSPAISFQGSDTLKLVLCDNGNPSLCDTITLVAHVSIDNQVQKIIPVNSLVIFPNPFNDKLNLQIKNSDGFEKSIILYDITGKECLRQKFSSTDEIIYTSRLRQGLYMLQIYSGARLVGSQKLLKIE
jgi:hypothetical protein